MRVSRIAFVPIALTLAACSAADAPPPKTAAAPPKKSAPAAPARASLPPGHLARGDVDGVLPQGPAWLFARVPIEAVIGDDRRFVGWRILALPPEWKDVDLKAGDVVTSVNGMPIERPEEFFTAWSSLTVASDLKIAYQRDNAARETTFHIDGDPSKSPPPALKADAPPPAATSKGLRGGKVVVIPGDDAPPDDGD